jgi:hypothetical protein
MEAQNLSRLGRGVGGRPAFFDLMAKFAGYGFTKSHAAA